MQNGFASIKKENIAKWQQEWNRFNENKKRVNAVWSMAVMPNSDSGYNATATS